MRTKHLAILTLVLAIYLAIRSALHECGVAVYSNLTSQDRVANLSSREKQVFALISGTRIYVDDLKLEMVANSYFAYRSANSPGANETAN